jgi:hypothetical protein
VNRLPGAALALFIASTPLLAQSPSLVPPAGFSRITGAVVVTPTGVPEFGMAYPLAEWSSIFHLGHGSIQGIMSKHVFGLGVGHRFTDYQTPAGEVVSFTIGPCFTMAFGGKGFRSGNFGIFGAVGFHRADPPPK